MKSEDEKMSLTTQPMPLTTQPMPVLRNNTRDIIGYTLLVVSCVMWGAIAALPFLSLSAGTATVIGGVLLIVGEGAFVAGAAMVGTQVWNWLKGLFKARG